jgi:DMSO/TMAO reductase YedYZ molybdopterin-dependent catalytic subunit
MRNFRIATWTRARKLLLLGVLLVSLATIPNTTSASEAQEEWSIMITGLVDRPYNLSLSEMLKMPATVVEAELYCVDGPAQPILQGKWRGVALKTILERAVPNKDVVKIAFHAGDGFTSDLVVEDALKKDVTVAYELNGEQMQGSKFSPGNRLVVPGQWGYKWVAGIAKIEAVDYDFLGVWESRGYPDKATISPVEQACAASALDPRIYLAFVIMGFVVLVTGRSYLKRRRIESESISQADKQESGHTA